MLADVKDADSFGSAAQGCSDLLAMLAALGMVIRQHDNIGAAQKF